MGETVSDERSLQDEWVERNLKKKIPIKGASRDRNTKVVRRKGKVLASPKPKPLPLPPSRPPQLQHAVESKLMTFDELKNKIGHAPRPDKLGGKWGMSKRYKVLENEVSDSQQKISDLEGKPATDLTNDRDAVEAEITDQIDAMIKAAEKYKKAKFDSKKKNAAQALIDQAKKYKADLKSNLDAILDDPKFDRVAPSCTIGELLAAKMRGLNFADCKFDVHNDDKLDVQNSNDNFGSGAVNSVAKLTHEDGIPRVFKPEPLDDPKMKKGPRVAGIDPEAPHYGNRNVASKIAGDLLGNNVMPEATFATHNGDVGLMMSMAKGKSPRVKKWTDYGGTGDPDTFPDFELANQRLEKRNGKWQQYEEKLKRPWTAKPSPKAQAKLQEELNALEWTDMLTGQVDRHSANYFVDIQGDDVKVTGIDNDFCFGKNQKTLLKYSPDQGVTSAGQPALIDKKTYDRLVAMDFDRDTLPRLKGLLTDEEIAATRDRFSAVINLAKQMESDGLVVQDWSAWRSGDQPPKTAAQYLKDSPGRGGSLFKRDFAAFFEQDGML